MSAGRLRREIGTTFVAVLAGIPGWLLIAPLARLIPKRSGWLAVIGRDEGKFLDNTKYFFLQGAPLLAPGVRMVFITERSDVGKLLEGTRYETLTYPSWKSVWFLLRSKTVIVDSTDWVWRFRRFLLAGAKRVQLWHGVGYKRIELDKWRNEPQGNRIMTLSWMPLLRRITKIINGRLVRYDAVNTTSEFYREKVFVPALMSRHFIVMGYPRNTFGKLGGAAESVAWRNVDAAITQRLPEWSARGRRIVLVAPTFRDSRGSPLGLDSGTVAMLDDYCEKQGVEFVFKFHPGERQANRIQGRHLRLCGPDSDLYPLMPLSSALITDYSSIFMDYLWLDKPVLFLVPDLDDYVRKDRQLQFDFHEMTPGPKTASWQEVTAALTEQWRHDEYGAERARLRRLAFDDLPQDRAVPGLIEFMRGQGWLPDGPRA